MPRPIVRPSGQSGGVGGTSLGTRDVGSGTLDPKLFGGDWQPPQTERSFPWRGIGVATVLVMIVGIGFFVYDFAKPPAASRWSMSDKFGFATDVYASSLLGLQKFDDKYIVGIEPEVAFALLKKETEKFPEPRRTILLADLIYKFNVLRMARPQFEFALNAGAAGISSDRVTVVLSIDQKYRHLFSVNARGECILLENAALVESEQTGSGARMTVEEGVYRIPVSLPWAKDALRQLEHPADIHVEVSARFQDGTGHTKQYSIKVHPPTQIESLYPWGMGFAACVDEDHPWIDEIIAEINNDPSLKAASLQLTGGGGGDKGRVISMYLVWRHLARRGIRYSNVVGTNQEHQGVQLFHDAYQDKVANCVDGSMMLASIYGRLGLQCSLVLIPDHCFLAVWDAVGEHAIFLETTRLGATNEDFQPLEEFFPDSLRGDPQFGSFCKAWELGEKTINESLEKAKDAAAQFNARLAAHEQNSTPETLQALKETARTVGNHLELVPISLSRAELGVESIGAPTNLSKSPPPVDPVQGESASIGTPTNLSKSPPPVDPVQGESAEEIQQRSNWTYNGFSFSDIDTGNARKILVSDGYGSAYFEKKVGGRWHAVIKNAHGQVIFDGDPDSESQRAAIPPNALEILEHFEKIGPR